MTTSSDSSQPTDLNMTRIESDYLTELTKDAAKWRMLKRRAQRHPNEKLITAVAETERG